MVVKFENRLSYTLDVIAVKGAVRVVELVIP